MTKFNEQTAAQQLSYLREKKFDQGRAEFSEKVKETLAPLKNVIKFWFAANGAIWYADKNKIAYDDLEQSFGETPIVLDEEQMDEAVYKLKLLAHKFELECEQVLLEQLRAVTVKRD